MNYFSVKVFKNGRPEPDIEVSGGANHGWHAFGTDEYTTDDEGIATIEWSTDTYLDTIYIEGTAYRGEFYDGGRKRIDI